MNVLHAAKESLQQVSKNSQFVGGCIGAAATFGGSALGGAVALGQGIDILPVLAPMMAGGSAAGFVTGYVLEKLGAKKN